MIYLEHYEKPGKAKKVNNSKMEMPPSTFLSRINFMVMTLILPTFIDQFHGFNRLNGQLAPPHNLETGT